MTLKPVYFENVGLPTFSHLSISCSSFSPINESEGQENSSVNLFDLSSHQRAREAIEFGLKMRDKGFHIFVMGEERSGRLTSTMEYLKNYIKGMPAANDWIYLNNFHSPHKPKPFSLPAGEAIKLKEYLSDFIETLSAVINKAFNTPSYIRQVDVLSTHLQSQFDEQIMKLKNYAKEKGFSLTQTADGFHIELLENEDEASHSPVEVQDIKERINKLSITAQIETQKVQKKIRELQKSIVKKSISSLFLKFDEEHGVYLKEWIHELKEDILNNLESFQMSSSEEEDGGRILLSIKEKYAVNVFVDNSHLSHSRVIIEPNPSYENLFGSIKYRTSASGALETNFTMIRAGALHHANGGILVLRADALAKNPDIWEKLKAALRDKVIRIEERQRESNLPLLDAPEPHSIPLDAQIFLIASPFWYYNFFFNDPEFRSYFKIKADIDPDMPATYENICVYKKLLKQSALTLTGKNIEDKALTYLIGYSARWVGHRERLSACFEQIADILHEAAVLSTEQENITEDAIKKAFHFRRMRNTRIEDRHYQEITTGQILMHTEGYAIGQVNGLSVLSTGDHQYGLPCRISARSYVGDQGVVNIERLTEMSGPIQQKGAFILEGFLNGIFGQKYPLSYSCSLTFEQSYVDIEGDSATIAELIAILSSLSGLPVRQDVAITGSLNQFGSTQPVGGVHFKIEAFHRVCLENGLTGTQGVIIPKANLHHLTLRDDVVEDIKHNRFFIWAVDSIFEVIELIFNTPCGVQYNERGIIYDNYPSYEFEKDSVFYRVEKTLAKYHTVTSKK